MNSGSKVSGWFKSKPGKADSIAPAVSTPPYEVGEFSIKHGISIIEARRILRENGQSREEADAAAEAVKLALGGRAEKRGSPGRVSD